jgi:hypothetical protein
MKRTLEKSPTIGRGSVRADEVMSLREFGRRLGLASRALCDAQRAGLKTVLLGRTKYVIGKHALQFFERLAAEAQGAEGGE